MFSSNIFRRFFQRFHGRVPSIHFTPILFNKGEGKYRLVVPETLVTFSTVFSTFPWPGSVKTVISPVRRDVARVGNIKRKMSSLLGHHKLNLFRRERNVLCVFKIILDLFNWLKLKRVSDFF